MPILEIGYFKHGRVGLVDQPARPCFMDKSILGLPMEIRLDPRVSSAEPRFMVDAMLGGLARWLRILLGTMRPTIRTSPTKCWYVGPWRNTGSS